MKLTKLSLASFCLSLLLTSCYSFSVDLETYSDKYDESIAVASAYSEGNVKSDEIDNSEYASINFAAKFDKEYEGVSLNIKSLRTENGILFDAFLNIQEATAQNGYPSDYTQSGILINSRYAVNLFRPDVCGNEIFVQLPPVEESAEYNKEGGLNLIIEYDMIVLSGTDEYNAFEVTESRIIPAKYLKKGCENTYVIDFSFCEITFEPSVASWNEN